jgi:queuine tRNA-ribosyltransferase
MFSFHILKQSKTSRARVGVLETPHGIVETPCLVPVATQATVKTLTSEQVSETGTQILIANTYHLHLRPGERVVKKTGGLHAFMQWTRPLMTDSGGFQVFSLGFGRDHAVGKINTGGNMSVVQEHTQPQQLRITEEGVWFRSHIDGEQLFIGPKESMRIQEALGADIMFAFDECTPPLADYAYTKTSLERTHRWAKECLRVKKNNNRALFGIVQGGRFKDLRITSAKYIAALPFDGFGIGGEFGNDKRTMVRMLRWVVAELPKEKPRHLLGIGHPEDIPRIIKEGIDTFDCIVPTHYARHGTAFTSRGRLDMHKRTLLADKKPLDVSCACPVCNVYSRAYVAHLIRAHEITGLSLLTMHNLWFFNAYVAKLREQIKNGKL